MNALTATPSRAKHPRIFRLHDRPERSMRSPNRQFCSFCWARFADWSALVRHMAGHDVNGRPSARLRAQIARPSASLGSATAAGAGFARDRSLRVKRRDG